MREKARRLLALGTAVCLAAVCLAVPAGAADRQSEGISDFEWQVLALINKERMGQGLAPLTAFSTLQKAAHIRTDDLAVEYRGDHTRPNGERCDSVLPPLGLYYYHFGENIAAGYTSPESVMVAWMNSPGHRANILGSDYRHVGVGYGTEDHQGYGTVWEQMFLDKDCTYSSLSVEPASVVLEAGGTLAGLDVTVTLHCAVHGDCILPLSPGMCYDYDETAAGTQSVRVVYTDSRQKDLTGTLTVLRAPWSKCSPWAREELVRAAEGGIIPPRLTGTDFTAGMTRAEFAATAVALYDAMGGVETGTAENPFSDTGDPAVLRAWSLGIVSGVGGGRFDPEGPLTREQAAVMLAQTYRALGGTVEGGSPSFPDKGEISPWALEAVAFLAGRGLVQGDNAGRFLPRSALTRESALLMAVRMWEKLG